MPGRRFSIRYWPVPSVTTDRTFSIRAGLAASMVTPGRTAPDASFTRPTIEPCAYAAAGASTTHAIPSTHFANSRIAASVGADLTPVVHDGQATRLGQFDLRPDRISCWLASIQSTRMDDHFVVTCPYCGEGIEIYVEPDVHGTFVQDCEVCCNPWRVRVVSDDDPDRHIEVSRADGSEESRP